MEQFPIKKLTHMQGCLDNDTPSMKILIYPPINKWNNFLSKSLLKYKDVLLKTLLV